MVNGRVAFLSSKSIKAENELKMLVFSLFCAFLDFFPFNFSILGANLGADRTKFLLLRHTEIRQTDPCRHSSAFLRSVHHFIDRRFQNSALPDARAEGCAKIIEV